MRKGFTLIETVLASSIMTLVVVAAVGSWLMFMYKSNRVNQQAILDMDARKVVERFRHEVRNAARETIMFYPDDREPYEALGFALAQDSDNDGLMDMDASGSNILWRQTVVYHVWRGSETPQMRRTVFQNRNNNADYNAYYGQMENVVQRGSGSGASLAGERAATTMMFENLFTGKLWHAEARFDGYAPQPNTREPITFGSLQLGPGTHRVDFTVIGKNPASTGRAIRLDQLSASVSGWPMEAEFLSSSGASAGSVFAGPNQAGAAYGLHVATAADGHRITMTLHNDAIEEVEFIGAGRNVSLSNSVVRFEESFTPANRPQGAFAAMLDGRFAPSWQGGLQTADGARSVYFYPTNCLIRVPLMANWVTQDGFGPVFRVYKSLYNGALTIVNPNYALVPTPVDGSPPGPNVDPNDTVPLEFWQDGNRMNDWAGCASMAYVELRPANTVRVEQRSTIMLTFEVRIGNYMQDRLTAFRMLRPNLPGCWVLLPRSPGQTGAVPGGSELTNQYQVVRSSELPLLEFMAVGYADKGEYVSHVYDTRSFNGATKTIEWHADIPAGAAITMFARSGDVISDNGFDIPDAPQWGALSEIASGSTVPGTGRYIQFRTLAVAQPNSLFPGVSGAAVKGPYRSDTPRLHRVLFTWAGEEKYVDIAGTLLKNPDCGIFKVEVNDKPLIRGVTMEIEIFKDINTMGNRKERIKSGMMAEVEPRNSKRR